MRATALLLAAALLTLTLPSPAQWTLQPSPTTSDLRGIDNVGNGIAWASGTNGTILRTTDSGLHWRLCTTPPNAAPLDFRGIQAFDATTAIAMSSGPGDLSRLYKTTDACQSWTLVFTNPDKDGFWDAIASPALKPPEKRRSLLLLGDPTSTHPLNLWKLRKTKTGTWRPERLGKALPPGAGPSIRETVFAASNSSLVVFDTGYRLQYGMWWIGTGGPGGAYFFGEGPGCWDSSGGPCGETVPVGEKSATSGVLNIAFATPPKHFRGFYATREQVVAVGGDYTKPDNASAVAAYSVDWGRHWDRATTQPHGYRSAVAYDAPTRTWITVGPNGTDISTDDGRNWRPLTPSKDDSPDADRNWNALSLPYVVGPHGRIGLLNPSALQRGPKTP